MTKQEEFRLTSIVVANAKKRLYQYGNINNQVSFEYYVIMNVLLYVPDEHQEVIYRKALIEFKKFLEKF